MYEGTHSTTKDFEAKNYASKPVLCNICCPIQIQVLYIVMAKEKGLKLNVKPGEAW